MTGAIQQEMFLQIGRKRYQIGSFKDASEFYSAARDRLLMTVAGGASRFPQGLIVSETGEEIARISYNGRVWPPSEWHSDMVPLYDNR